MAGAGEYVNRAGGPNPGIHAHLCYWVLLGQFGSLLVKQWEGIVTCLMEGGAARFI